MRMMVLEAGTDQEFLDCLEKLDIRPCYFCGQLVLKGDRLETLVTEYLVEPMTVYRCRNSFECGQRTSAIVEQSMRNTYNA